MLLRSGDLPSAPGWSYEPKWDGFRALVHVGDPWRSPRIVSRHGTDLTARFPELAGIADAVGTRRVVLDGELIVCGADGRPDFDRLRARMTVGGVRLRSAAASAPAVFIAFDVLWCDGDVTEQPYLQRRERLLELGLTGDRWQVTPASADGQALWRAVEEHDLEGLVAKRLNSRYYPGRRSADWLKVKNWQRCQPLVGGFTLGRNGGVRSLLVGLEDGRPDGQLRLGEGQRQLRRRGGVRLRPRRESRARRSAEGGRALDHPVRACDAAHQRRPRRAGRAGGGPVPVLERRPPAPPDLPGLGQLTFLAQVPPTRHR